LVLRPHTSRPNAVAEAGAPNEGFLREVDEALREQEVVDALRSHGKKAAVLIVAVLVALAGYLWWDGHRKGQMGERSEQLTMALDAVEAGKLDAAKAQLATLGDKGGDGVQAAARLMQAGILSEQGKVADAQKLFAAVAADAAAPQPYRDLATVREISLGFDVIPADQIVARLKPLAIPGKPWFGSAGELLGAAYLKQGQNNLAGPLFAQIARDKTVPATLQRRARQMAGLLGVDAVDDVNEAVGSALGAAGPAPVAAPAPAQAGPAPAAAPAE
jgi:hypothetical protein